jgi:hypothetical protein
MIDNLLKLEIETYAERLRRTSRLLERARRGELSSRAVQTFLWNIRYVLAQSFANLKLAESVARERGFEELAEFYKQKLAEEQGHDRWAEQDLLSLDPALDFGREVTPLEPLTELMAFLRASVRREPRQFLVYLLFAEYVTVLLGPEWVAALAANCGVPASSMTSIARHAELDKHHVQDDLQVMRTLLPVDVEAGELFAELRHVMGFWERFYDDVAELPN